MTKPKHTEGSFDLDAALGQLEAGGLGQELRQAGGALNPPPAAVLRLEGQLRRSIQPGPAAPRQPLGDRLRGLIGRRGRAGSLSLALIAVLAVALLLARNPARSVSAAELIAKAERRAAEVVPAGKIRHIVRELVDVENGQTYKAVDEVWLAEGDGHLMLWQPARRAQPGFSMLNPLDPWLVNNEHVWSFRSDINTLYRAPFDACALSPAEWVGDPQFLAEMRASENLRLVGEEELDGRRYSIVQFYDTRLWVDPQTGQIVQTSSVVDFEGGHRESIDRVVVDELIDAADAPPGLFTFQQPAGSTLVEQERLCVNG